MKESASMKNLDDASRDQIFLKDSEIRQLTIKLEKINNEKKRLDQDIKIKNISSESSRLLQNLLTLKQEFKNLDDQNVNLKK
jgi:seryl-tRNA synthetase